MLTVEWVAGFVEGEGSFSGSMRTPTYYQPNFSLYQKDKNILEQVATFLEAHEIPSKIYCDYKGLHVLSVNSVRTCRLLYKLLRPHMHAPVKIVQADTWAGRLNYAGRNVKGEPKTREIYNERTQAFAFKEEAQLEEATGR